MLYSSYQERLASHLNRFKSRQNSKLFKSKLRPLRKENKGMFVHASIRTSNLERSIQFYTKFFELKVVKRMEIQQTNAELAFLQDPGTKGALLELTFYRSQKLFVQADYDVRLFDHLAFEVRDMTKTIDEMRKAGVTITDEPYRLNPTGNLLAFAEDPDGTLIELIEKNKKNE
jgi:lactoylglutathione lyase